MLHRPGLLVVVVRECARFHAPERVAAIGCVNSCGQRATRVGGSFPQPLSRVYQSCYFLLVTVLHYYPRLTDLLTGCCYVVLSGWASDQCCSFRAKSRWNPSGS